MATARDATAFVASSRPPRPTSSTATSTLAARNTSSASAVVASKKLGGASIRPAASITRAACASSTSARNRFAIDGESFLEVDEVRRREAPGPQAGGSKAALHHGGDGALAVRAGDDEAGIARSGWSSRASRRRIWSRPSLMPICSSASSDARADTGYDSAVEAWSAAGPRPGRAVLMEAAPSSPAPRGRWSPSVRADRRRDR